ncbi:hypothetical protein SNE40_015452 [Patella caerulea]|uniref:Uncharacterized protein n=1 Tax=Patella caerulea TaxID=87958 RepID=A0AAN8PV77_PATCE
MELQLTSHLYAIVIGILCLIRESTAKICKEYEEDCLDVEPSPEVLGITIVLCAGAFLSILCPIICLIKPCNTKWKRILSEKLGWDFASPTSNMEIRTSQIESGENSEVSRPTVQETEIAVIDLPPSYDEVIKNSDLYSFHKTTINQSVDTNRPTSLPS